MKASLASAHQEVDSIMEVVPVVRPAPDVLPTDNEPADNEPVGDERPETVDRLRAIALFAGLNENQLRDLLAVGEVSGFVPGEMLFREAQPADDWWVLLEGTIDLVRHVAHEDTVLGAMSSP